jgi:hypothetical protein
MFSQLLADCVRPHHLMSIDLNFEVLQSLFEHICGPLDEPDRQTGVLEKANSAKPDKAEVGSRTDTIEHHLDDLERDLSLVPHKVH